MNEEQQKLIGTPEARVLIEEAGLGPVTLPTVIGWCRQYGLGVKIGGRWYLYEEKLTQFLKGKRNDDKKETEA